MFIKYQDANYSTQWNAVAQTMITWGRVLTTEEKTQSSNLRATLLASGVIGSFNIEGDSETGTYNYYWSTVDAANQWLALANSFSPAPTSAVLVNPPVPIADVTE
jgi:hypothetical protein